MGWREAARPVTRHRPQSWGVSGGRRFRGWKKVGVQSAVLQGYGEGDAKKDD